jgi:endonuclease YncB( thermonuclease family)
MARRIGRRQAGLGRVAQPDAELLIGLVLIAGGLGYYAYRHWNASPPPAIVGKAWVIDGDTINISGTHIRLEGIDAPELDQPCTDSKGKIWSCGKAAAGELKARIGAQELTCASKAFDKYKRVVAVCTLSDGSDVNAWLVQQGWAVAYGYADIYESQEAEARAAKRGIWAGSFVMPSQWRQSQKID